MNQFSWALYWRNSLADAESGKGSLKKKDVESFIDVGKDIFEKGVLPQDIVSQLFSGEDSETRTVSIIYRPTILIKLLQHGKTLTGIYPEIISPVICPLYVNRQGYMYPSAPASVPRDILSPQDDAKFILGSVKGLDAFLTENPIHILNDSDIPNELNASDIEAFIDNWKSYYDHCLELYSNVCIGLKQSDLLTHYSKPENVLLCKIGEYSGASRSILNLYDSINSSKPQTPLFENYSNNQNIDLIPCIEMGESIVSRYGHSNDQYALADAQRDALTHAIKMSNGEILAINGPPGTGKTTFVLSVVASLWVEAAIDEAEPPVIVAASTNNQAVTNVIDAFGKDFSEGTGELSGRWLPDLSSYGAYFPAKYRQSEAQDIYQTSSFFESIETEDYIESAESYYMDKVVKAFPNLGNVSLKDVPHLLREQLKINKHKLKEIKNGWDELCSNRDQANSVIGAEPQYILNQLEQQIQTSQQNKHRTDNNLEELLNFQAQESIWFALFSWLPPVSKKRDLKRKLFISNTFCNNSKNQIHQVDFDDIEPCLIKLKQDQQNSINIHTSDYAMKLKVAAKLERSEEAWKVIAESLGVKSVPLPDIDICDKAADTAIRFIMFRLAVHYWEARWLLASKELGDRIEKDKGKKGLKTIAPRWKRRMMLTPCIVSTFHALPNLMVATAFNEGRFDDEPMFNFIDLLIVDEAGQVSPDVAGASFALAKKALVIGDIHQIEPIQSITGPIDIGNLFSQNIIKNREEYEYILDSGRSVVNGSVMHIAQKASNYHYQTKMESGMFLREHRRCYDEIISFCNELCYKGILLPKRGTSGDSTKYPPLGYLHVDGLCSQNSGGSRYNELEAETIASWLHENRSQLESEYGSSVEDSIGIVTPFSAQVSLIQIACEKYGFKAAKKKGGITIGTVHALQGAERNLVIFSPVYSRHNDGGFIDSSSSMLNVAVSRAKNSFMVFGDMDVISASPKSQPRGVLAKYLFTDQTNEIVFSLKQRSDLLDKGMAPRLINNSEEHDAYIVELLKQAVDSVSIVSPWIQLEKLKDTGLLNALITASKRGVIIDVYVDRHFNVTSKNQFNTLKEKEFNSCCEYLSKQGLTLYVIKGVHSKLVMADNKHLSVGSFNWFSASRNDQYKNLETSLIYTGDLEKEIAIQKTFLQGRANKKYEAKLNQVEVYE
jgi:hypothetical protein